MRRAWCSACAEYWNSLFIIFCPFTISFVAAKKSFVLRVDDDTYKALEKWAADDFRSVNGQIEWLLDKALKDTGRKKNKVVEIKKTNDSNNRN